jgi:hypothetical protein
MLTKCSDLSEKAGSIAQRNSAKACDPALKELCLRSALFGESYFPKTREAQIPALPTGLLSHLAQRGIGKSLGPVFLVIDRPRRSVHTKDAKDSGLLGIRYYEYLIVDLYHRSRLHLSLDKDSPDSRPIQSVGKIVAHREVGGLHHRYARHAA